MGILYIAFGAACIYFLQAAIYKKLWNKNLSAAVEFNQHAITEQEEGELSEIILNQKWLPLPMLRVKFEADRHLDFIQEANVSVTDRCYKHDIFSVMMYQKITRRLKFKANRRGFYEIKQINMDSTDLFMEKHLDMDVECNAYIYVYPGQADPRRLLIPFQKMMGELLTKRYTYEDPFEFQGIRQYEPVDNMRDVNWKATARSGELRTNVHGFTMRQEVCLLLNLESETLMDDKDLKEESIRLVNSLAEMFLAQIILVGVYSNARDLVTGKELILPQGGGSQHLTLLRERLARLDLSQPMEDFHIFLERSFEENRDGMLYVLISSSQRQEVSRAFGRLADNSAKSLWMIPMHSWMEQREFSNENVSVMRWDVE